MAAFDVWNGGSERIKKTPRFLTAQDAVSRLSGPQGCSIHKPVPGSMPFGQERSQEDQIQLFVGNIMRKAVEIKEHRLKNLRGTGPGDRGRGASRGQVGAGVKPRGRGRGQT
jgi:hypothetical protein